MIRKDFVSNSSSSSFICIVNTGHDETNEIKMKYRNKEYPDLQLSVYFPNKDAKHIFGWENEFTCDIGGKLNFIAMQLLYILQMEMERFFQGFKNDKSKYHELLQMTKKVCLDNFNFIFNVDVNVITVNPHFENGILKDVWLWFNHEYGIDHQSCAVDNSSMEMFESEESLLNFLKYKNSGIEGGNDNYGG